MKITQNESQQPEGNRERINSIKTDAPDVNKLQNNAEVETGTEQMEEKSNDNASSASTVEVLDDK